MNESMWADFPLLLGSPQGSGPDVAVFVRGTRFIELPENGFFALIAWCAGPARVIRYRDDRPPAPVRVTQATAGETETWYEERTPSDQAIVQHEIDSYLADAGIPAQPPGYRWFVQAPMGVESSGVLFGAFDSRIAREVANPPTPAKVLPVILETVREIYRDSDADSGGANP